MKLGALFCARMLRIGHYIRQYFHEFSEGFRRIEFNLPRLSDSDYYVNFAYSEEEWIYN